LTNRRLFALRQLRRSFEDPLGHWLGHWLMTIDGEDDLEMPFELPPKA
jgi:hypothetical protein